MIYVSATRTMAQTAFHFHLQRASLSTLLISPLFLAVSCFFTWGIERGSCVWDTLEQVVERAGIFQCNTL